ncbi:uncharacterized protein ACN2A1_008898 [Glossina fuscipes fuscipes]
MPYIHFYKQMYLSYLTEAITVNFFKTCQRFYFYYIRVKFFLKSVERLKIQEILLIFTMLFNHKMSLTFVRKSFQAYKGCRFFGTIKNTHFYNSNSIASPKENYGLLKPVKKLLPFAIIKRHGLVNVRIREYPSNRRYTIIWILEQIANVSLIFLMPTAFLCDNKEIDFAMGIAALLHSYCGMQSVISDYMRSAVVGKALPIITRVLVVIFSIAALCGLYQLVYDDIGIAPTIKKFWVITGPKEPEPAPQEVEKVHPKKRWFRRKSE